MRRFGLALVALFGLGAYLLRRRLLAAALKLPPPRAPVKVERDIAVVMADGVRLLADHYSPAAAGSFPTILIRTPYGRGREVALLGGAFMAELPAGLFAERGYHVVVQTVRGCLDSEGTFSPHAHEAADGQATAEWIERQPWFSGALATWGPSYLGYTQWATAAGQPASLKAMAPMITSAENFSVSHPDGAFGLETRLRWAQGMHEMGRLHGRPLREHLRARLAGKQAEKLEAAFDHLPLGEADVIAAGEAIPFFREILGHEDPDASFWQARDHRQAVSDATAPAHFVGGWYDYYLRGLLRDYETLRSAGRSPYLTIGPWWHAHPAAMLEGLRQALAWYDAHLKGDKGRLRRKPVRLCVMGSGEWLEMEAFPPPFQKTQYYLLAGGALATDRPGASGGYDSYIYDPLDPTPAVGGAVLAMQGAGPQDNQSLETRSDVLVYSTPPLGEAVEIIGPVSLRLYVRSSLADTDFFGRLCDVSPDGRSTNICDGLARLQPGSHKPLPDGAIEVEVDMWDTAYRFQAGHQIRLLVASGAHPRWSRNLGTGQPLATGTATAVAEQTVFHDAGHPSALVLPLTRVGDRPVV